MNKVIREGFNFYIKLGEVIISEIKCKKFNDELHVISSFTQEDYRGRGIASKIMKEVIKFAKENRLKIIPKCSFAVNYCKKNEC